MPRPTQPAEYAILGLLYFEQAGGHGYDLARHFADDQPLGDVLKLEPGMLYHHLKKLGRTGWVTVDVEPQGTRPPGRSIRSLRTGRPSCCAGCENRSPTPAISDSNS